MTTVFVFIQNPTSTASADDDRLHYTYPYVWHSHEKGIIQVNDVSHIVVSK